MALGAACAPTITTSLLVHESRASFSYIQHSVSRHAAKAHICRCRSVARGSAASEAFVKSWVVLAERGLPLLDVYVFKEMVPVLVMALGVLATLGMSLLAMVGLVRQVATSGLPLGVAVAAALLQMPKFISQTMPVACMAASLVTFGRMQADHEFVALFAAGVTPLRLLVAPVCLCMLSAMFKLGCDEVVIPYASTRSQEMLVTAFTSKFQSTHQSNDLIFEDYSSAADGELQRIWYARKQQGCNMQGMLLLEMYPSGELQRVIVADKASWDLHEEVCQTQNTTVVEISRRNSLKNAIHLQELEVPCLDLFKAAAPANIFTPSLNELSQHALKQQIAHLLHKLRCLASHQGTDITACNAGRMKLERDLRKAMYLLHYRNASTVSCLVYGLMGASVTLATSKCSTSSKNRVVASVAALLSAGLYSSFSALAGVAGSSGLLPPVVSAWFVPLIFGFTVAAFTAFDSLSTAKEDELHFPLIL